jgi:hypothetical protein
MEREWEAEAERLGADLADAIIKDVMAAERRGRIAELELLMKMVPLSNAVRQEVINRLAELREDTP